MKSCTFHHLARAAVDDCDAFQTAPTNRKVTGYFNYYIFAFTGIG